MITLILDEEKRIAGFLNGEIENGVKVENLPHKNFWDYKYINGKYVFDEYKPDLNKIKKRKLEEIKNARDKFIKSDLNMNGDLFQVRDTEDRDKFNRILLGLLLKKLKKEDTEEWRLANNTYKVFTYAELSNIPELYSTREREAFKKFHQLEDSLQACNSIDEINALKWE